MPEIYDMNIYKDLGFLILGSRLRRMSEYFLAQVNKVYQEKGLPFEAGWFPLFFIISRHEAISLRSVADELGTSHSAVSQLVKNLKHRGLLETVTDDSDKRSQLIQLTEQGKALQAQLIPIWKEIASSLTKMKDIHPDVAFFLPALQNLEDHFEKRPLSEIILENLK